MSNWIKEIRKLSEEAEARKDASAAKGHPNGAFQEPSHIVAARELMAYFNDSEKEAEKNLQNRYTAPPQEIVDQIGAVAYRPKKLSGSSLVSRRGARLRPNHCLLHRLHRRLRPNHRLLLLLLTRRGARLRQNHRLLHRPPADFPAHSCSINYRLPRCRRRGARGRGGDILC